MRSSSFCSLGTACAPAALEPRRPAAGEKRSVYAIGWLSSDVTPGDAVHASMALDGMTLELDTTRPSQVVRLDRGRGPDGVLVRRRAD